MRPLSINIILPYQTFMISAKYGNATERGNHLNKTDDLVQ